MGGLADCKVFTPTRSLTNNRNQLVVNGVPEYETATSAESVHIYLANLKFSKTKDSLLPLYSGIQVAYS